MLRRAIGMTGDMFAPLNYENQIMLIIYLHNIKFPFDYEPSAVPYIITIDKNNKVTIKNEFDEKQSIEPSLNLPLNNYVFYIDHQDLSETIIEREDDTTYIKQCIIYNDNSELSDDVDSEILTENSVKYYINSNK